MFDFAEKTNDMSAIEILNYYRNLYYAEPQVTERGIVANAINDVLNTICSQKAEVERLKKRISDKKHTLLEQQTYTAELQRKLETKCDDCDNIRLSRPEYWKAIKAAKAEAYKEFAERLNKKAFYSDYTGNVVRLLTVNHILKEMVGNKLNFQK